jgi:hypothetical protein
MPDEALSSNEPNQRAARRRIDHGARYRPATTIRSPSRLTVRVVQPTVGGIPASARARTQSNQQLARTGEHPTPSAMSFAAGKFQPQSDPLRSCRTSRTGRLLLGDCTSERLELPPGFRRALSQKALVRTCRRAMPMPHSDAGRVLSVGCERLEEAVGRPKRALALWR